MNSGDTLHRNVYLYRIHDGIFECMKGRVLWYPRGSFVFVPDTSFQRYTISNGPGVVYWGNMWIFERDDDKARELFRKHYEAKIATCEAKIKRIEKKIVIATEDDIRVGS